MSRRRVVVLYPNSPGSREILEFLEERKIPYLDYSDLDIESLLKVGAYIPDDCHPSAGFNELLAEQIALDLARPENAAVLGKLFEAR